MNNHDFLIDYGVFELMFLSSCSFVSDRHRGLSLHIVVRTMGSAEQGDHRTRSEMGSSLNI